MQERMDKTYINILIDTLRRKSDVLTKLEAATKAQEKLLQAAALDIDEFDRHIQEKTKLLERLDKLDEGFEDLYEHVGTQLKENKELYKEEILTAQKLIRAVTELNVSIQSLEERNRGKLSLYVSEGKQKIKDFKVGNKTAAAYYKNMSSQHQEGQSYFLDKKK